MSKTSKSSIQRSIQIAIRRPHTGVTLLANTFTKCIDATDGITKNLKIEFCLLFLNAILENTYPKKYTDLSKRLKNRSIYLGIRLLKRYPHEGIKILVGLIMNELVENQQYSTDELVQFYNEVFFHFFPEARFCNECTINKITYKTMNPQNK